MSFDSTIRQYIVIDPGFPPDQDTTKILDAMRSMYDKTCYADDGSVEPNLFKNMLDGWVKSNGPITIRYRPGALGAVPNSGTVSLDMRRLDPDATVDDDEPMYIDNYGNAVKDTLMTALVHELMHALTGVLDLSFRKTRKSFTEKSCITKRK